VAIGIAVMALVIPLGVALVAGLGLLEAPPGMFLQGVSNALSLATGLVGLGGLLGLTMTVAPVLRAAE
jgi:hypothetical protein